MAIDRTECVTRMARLVAGVVCLVCAANAFAAAYTSAIIYYPLDENGGTVAADNAPNAGAQNGNVVGWQGTAPFTPDLRWNPDTGGVDGAGPALGGTGSNLPWVNLDVRNDQNLLTGRTYIQTPGSTTGFETFGDHGSIALWVKPRPYVTDPTGDCCRVQNLVENTFGSGSFPGQIEFAISHRSSFGGIDPRQRVFFYPNQGGGSGLIISDATLPFDQWTHVVVTWNWGGGTAREGKFYINGSLDPLALNQLPANWSSVASGAMLNSNGFTIGVDGDFVGFADQRSLPGGVTDIAFFADVLTLEEVQDIYNCGVGDFIMQGNCAVQEPQPSPQPQPAPSGGGEVPEPMTASLLLTAAICLTARRRRV